MERGSDSNTFWKFYPHLLNPLNSSFQILYLLCRHLSACPYFFCQYSSLFRLLASKLLQSLRIMLSTNFCHSFLTHMTPSSQVLMENCPNLCSPKQLIMPLELSPSTLRIASSPSSALRSRRMSPNWLPLSPPTSIFSSWHSTKSQTHISRLRPASRQNLWREGRSVLQTDTFWVVCPRLSLSPAEEKSFSGMPVALLRRKMALMVSIPCLYSTKWVYLCLALGFILRMFLLQRSLIIPLSRVWLSMKCSLYRTKSCRPFRSSLLPISRSSTTSHGPTRSPHSNWQYSFSTIPTADYPSSTRISSLSPAPIQKLGFSAGGRQERSGLCLSTTRWLALSISLTMKSLSRYLVMAGTACPGIMYYVIPTCVSSDPWQSSYIS